VGWTVQGLFPVEDKRHSSTTPSLAP